MYSHTLWIEPGCKLLAFGFAQRSELPRKDGRHDMNKGMQLWGAEGLGTACESLQLRATSFCLVLDPLPGNSVLVYHWICEKAFQYFNIFNFLNCLFWRFQKANQQHIPFLCLARWIFVLGSSIPEPWKGLRYHLSSWADTNAPKTLCQLMWPLLWYNFCSVLSSLSAVIWEQKSSALAETEKWLHFAQNK